MPLAVPAGTHVHAWVWMFRPMNPMASHRICVECGVSETKGK